jgi:hypothetical protein
MSISKRPIACPAFVILLLLQLACQVAILGTRETLEPVEIPEEATVERISENHVIRYDKDSFRMSSGNFMREEEYVDEQGVSRRGPTALLRWWEPGEPHEEDRVHVGQEIVFKQYRILVVEIGQDDYSKYVKVAISKVEEPGN